MLEAAEQLPRAVEVPRPLLLLHGLDQKRLRVLAERQSPPKDLGTPGVRRDNARGENSSISSL